MLSILLATVLILDGGTRIEGEIVERRNGRVVVRTVSGVLYSFSEDTIRSESNAAESRSLAKPVAPRRDRSSRLPELKIRVDEAEKKRLLAELSKNHSGKAAPKQSWEIARPEPVEEQLVVTERSDESYWREESRKRREAVLQSKEKLELLTRREREIEDTVRMMLATGVNPDHMGYQMIALADARTMRDQSRLDIERAERHLSALQEDARREGVLPGWLR